MDDTSRDVLEKMREMIRKKSPAERFKMGCSMYETSKYLVARAIAERGPIYSASRLRQELFLKFYEHDMDPAAKKLVLEHLGPEPNPNSDPPVFSHIPDDEKKQEWWKLLSPLIEARLSKDRHEQSRLLAALSRSSGIGTWRSIKQSIRFALEWVDRGTDILSRATEIREASDPDGIIDDLFSELRAIHYLTLKGFGKIRYVRRNLIHAEFDGHPFQIVTIHVHGPSFKTQEYTFFSRGDSSSPIYKIHPAELIDLLEGLYNAEKKQILSLGGIPEHSLIFMAADLEETHEPWLDHAKIEGKHPLLHFIEKREIPTVLFGCGSVYEPSANALGGAFGKLRPFEWRKYEALFTSSVS